MLRIVTCFRRQTILNILHGKSNLLCSFFTTLNKYLAAILAPAVNCNTETRVDGVLNKYRVLDNIVLYKYRPNMIDTVMITAEKD